MRRSIAIGPERIYPSWTWVGLDTARELGKYFDVVTFNHIVPDADVVIVVKDLVSASQMDRIKRAGTRLIYIPIDFFTGLDHITHHGKFLASCDQIILHSCELAHSLGRFAPVGLIDHHGKYLLPKISEYKDNGFVLWIGAFQNLPYLLRYVEVNSLDLEIQLLSDIDNARAFKGAEKVARTLQVECQIVGNRVGQHVIQSWSPELQAKMLCEAKAAIDIKGDNFNQVHKPPTKAQKYICSGVPLAMNSCGASRYFESYGLMIPSPREKRWLSREYYDQVCLIAERLRPSLTLEAIGLKYKAFIEEVLSRKSGSRVC